MWDLAVPLTVGLQCAQGLACVFHEHKWARTLLGKGNISNKYCLFYERLIFQNDTATLNRSRNGNGSYSAGD